MQSRPGKETVHDIRVTWADCDPAKIAYTARLPYFALDAINAWWETNYDGNGWFQLELDKNIGTPFVRMEIDFKSPVTPRHTLKCHVWPSRLGNSSVEFRVDGVQNGVDCFAGRFVCVFTRADKFEKQSAPADIRNLLEQHIPSEP